MKYKVEVRESIQGSESAVFPYLADLNEFMKWNPFPQMDDTSVSTVSDPGAGLGARLNWQGKRIGVGEMKIAEWMDNQFIRFDMTFGEGPKADRAQSTLRIARESVESVAVTWDITGERSLFRGILFKIIGLDRMMARHFKDGLTRLKDIVEA